MVQIKQISRVIFAIFFTLLILEACGQQNTAVPTEKTNIPSSTTLLTTTTRSTTILAVTPTNTTTPTIVPTATIIATPTIAPTATSIPSPTPTPIPDKVILGDINDPIGEITSYDALGTDQLVDITLKDQLLTEMSSWFQAVPELKTNLTVGGSKQNKFKLKISPTINNKILDGSFLPSGVKSQISFGFSDSGFNISPTVRFITPKLPLSPNAFWSIITYLGSQGFITEINAQFDKVNKKLDDIKGFLEQKELANLQGNITYLDSIRNTLVQQKLSDQDLVSIRNELESIERESNQSISFYKLQLENVSKKVDDIKLDKTLIFFPNDDWIADLKNLVSDYNQKGNLYLASLEVKAVVSQTIVALPYGRNLALSRLETVQTEISDWKGKEVSFYDLVEAKAKEIAGLYNKKEKADQFTQLVSNGKSSINQVHTDINTQLMSSILKVKNQVTDLQEPLVLVMELDSQGKVIKASKLTTR